MKPILYAANETAFTTNGLGILSDTIDATVEEALNGIYELEMTYPVKGIHFAKIRSRTIIMAKPNPVSDVQPFRVYRITKPLNGVVRIFARHIAYDLAGVTVSPFTASSAPFALQGLRENAVTDCPFQFVTDKTAQGTLTVSVPSSIWSLLGGTEGSVLDVFGGEYEFDRWKVSLLTRRGADRGVSIRYGKNLTSFEQDENCANCYTGVYPYWADTEGNLVELPEKVVYAEGDHGYTKILPKDFSSEWDAAPTEDQLRARTVKYIADNEIGIPDVSWIVEFIALEQTEEYKDKALLERVLVGDTVAVEFPEMSVSASARAVSARYKPLLERYERVALGRVKSNLADTIVEQKKEIEKKPSTQTMTSFINGKLAITIPGVHGGAVRMMDTDGDGQPDEFYIADNADPALAVKVWRFNYEGWAASKTGYEGPFEFGATLNDGLLANFVTAANLIAGTIQSADRESFYLNLDTGELRIKAVSEIEKKAIVSSVEQFYRSTSATALSGGSWSAAQPEWTNGTYIWRRNFVTYGDGTTAYTPSEKGVCITGNTGTNGVSRYIHIRYSANSNGNPMTSSPSSTTKYIGTCVTTSSTAPTSYASYKWVQCRGNDGVGIPGEPGADGKGIKSTSTTYQAGSSGTTAPTGTWSSVIPTVATGQYLWTKTAVTYTDETTSTFYSVSRMGADGTDGKDGANGQDGKDGVDGKGIKSTSTIYQAGSSGTTAPTGTWSSSVPSVPSGQYLWAKTVITYTDNTSSTSYSVSRMGTDGTPGAPGADGKSKYFHVKYSDDGETFTSNGGETLGDWMGTCITDSEADPTAFDVYTWKKIVGEAGQPGIDGADGHDGVSSYFYVKFSANANGNPMTEIPTSGTKYMGVCSTTSPTAPTSYTAYTWTQCRGNDGENGIPGEPGADGRTSYLHIKYSDDGKTFTANNGEDLGAWIGTLVDFNEMDSLVFSDYTWKKFTEDVDEELDEIRQSILEQYTQILNDSESVIMRALKSYVEKSSYDELKQTVESQFELLSNELSLRFSETVQQIENINGDLQSKYNNITKYFSFTINGMTIGAVNNPNKVIVDNDEVSILVNNVPVQSFDADGKALTPELKVTRTFDLLGYLIEKDADGNVNCDYIGEQ